MRGEFNYPPKTERGDPVAVVIATESNSCGGLQCECKGPPASPFRRSVRFRRCARARVAGGEDGDEDAEAERAAERAAELIPTAGVLALL